MICIYRIAVLCLCIGILLMSTSCKNLSRNQSERIKKMNDQKKSEWLDSVNKTTKQSGTFQAQDKHGRPVVLEWTKTNVRSPQFSELMHKLCDLTCDVYTSVELNFLKEYADQETHAAYCLPLDQLFKQGAMVKDWQLFKQALKKLDWPVVEEKMRLVLKSIQLMDYSQFSPEEVHIFVLIKDAETKELLGYAMFYVAQKFPKGSVKNTHLAVAQKSQRRGLGKLLMSSVLNIVPSLEQIFLSTRPSNSGALRAYESWGFVKNLEPVKEAHYSFVEKQWVNLRYDVKQIHVLQKTAETMRNN